MPIKGLSIPPIHFARIDPARVRCSAGQCRADGL